MRKLLCLFSLILFSPLFALANQEVNLSTNTMDAINLTDGTSSIGFLLLRYLIAVIFVVSLLYFTLKYISHKNAPKYNEGNWANLLDYTYLGNNRGLYLIEINNEGYVIGSTEQSLNLITKMETSDYQKIKGEMILNSQFNDFTVNPFKKRENKSFQNHLQQNLKIAEKYFRKKRD